MPVRTAKLVPLPQRPLFQPVTIADLDAFGKSLKTELLKEIRILLRDIPQPAKRKWLKNKAVMEMLEVSAGTLQTLRDTGVIPHSRIGKAIYYDPDDIEKEIQRRKSCGRNHLDQYLRKK